MGLQPSELDGPGAGGNGGGHQGVHCVHTEGPAALGDIELRDTEVVRQAVDKVLERFAALGVASRELRGSDVEAVAGPAEAQAVAAGEAMRPPRAILWI